MKLHYVLSDRNTAFWRDNRLTQSIPDRLLDLLELWKHQVPNVSDFEPTGELFQAASFQFVLYGSGYKTEPVYSLSGAEIAFVEEQIKQNQIATRNMLGSLPDHRALINQITQHGLSKV